MSDLARLISRLSALPDALHAAAVSAAGGAAAEAVRTARSIVPVRTGALRASITSDSLPDGAVISSALPYALGVELGTRGSAAHPYLLPAARLAGYPHRAALAAKEALP